MLSMTVAYQPDYSWITCYCKWVWEFLICSLILFSGVSYPLFVWKFIFMHGLVAMVGGVLTIVIDTLVIIVTLSNAMETLRQMRGFKAFQANSLSHVLVKQSEQYHSRSLLWLIIIKVLYDTCMFCIPWVGWRNKLILGQICAYNHSIRHNLAEGITCCLLLSNWLNNASDRP